MQNEVAIRRISIKDDLDAICAQMQPEFWDEVNDMGSYEPERLKYFLDRGGILLVAYSGEKIVGVALCYDMPHPDATSYTLYVHELDTHPDFRRQGIATLLMNEAIKLGKERGVSEVWVSTETTNDPANALYKKLGPDEIEPSITYSYNIKAS